MMTEVFVVVCVMLVVACWRWVHWMNVAADSRAELCEFRREVAKAWKQARGNGP